jgi:hypothetical protein
VLQESLAGNALAAEQTVQNLEGLLNQRSNELELANNQLRAEAQARQNLEFSKGSELEELKRSLTAKLATTTAHYEAQISALKIEMKEEAKFERGKAQAYMSQIHDMLQIIQSKENQIKMMLPEISYTHRTQKNNLSYQNHQMNPDYPQKRHFQPTHHETETPGGLFDTLQGMDQHQPANNQNTNSPNGNINVKQFFF